MKKPTLGSLLQGKNLENYAYFENSPSIIKKICQNKIKSLYQPWFSFNVNGN